MYRSPILSHNSTSKFLFFRIFFLFEGWSLLGYFQQITKTKIIKAQITESMLQKHYDDFYEEVFYEIESKYGEIEEMNVCENLGDHIVGNAYIKFYK